MLLVLPFACYCCACDVVDHAVWVVMFYQIAADACCGLQVPMDQGLNALDMISKFTRDKPLVQQDSPVVDSQQPQLQIPSEASVFGRRAGVASVAK